MEYYKEFKDLLELIYNKDESNFKIIENKLCENNKVCIYFSSNGIYYPDTKQEFSKKILEKDRYEWEKNIVKNCRKHILIRNLYKCWYINGINRKLNSIEKIIEFLLQETKGYKITTIGSSAGGFMAVLCGIYLKAERIFTFNGQFNLERISNENSILLKMKYDKKISKYYNLNEILEENTVPIYYFVSLKSVQDKENYEEVKKYSCIKSFTVNSKFHGIPLFLPSLEKLLELDNQSLNGIRSFKNKYIFAIKIMGIKKFIIKLITFIFKRIVEKIRKVNEF